MQRATYSKSGNHLSGTAHLGAPHHCIPPQQGRTNGRPSRATDCLQGRNPGYKPQPTQAKTIKDMKIYADCSGFHLTGQ